MSVMAVSSYRHKNAFRYLAATNVYDYENTPVNFFCCFKAYVLEQYPLFSVVRKGGFDAL